METFRTALKAQPAPFAIGHSDRLMLVGSCFTEHIGERLAAHKFPALTNPFGIVYNPASIVRSLERLFAENQFFSEQDIFENAGLWHSWEHHGRFSKPEKDAMLAGTNAAYSEAAVFFEKNKPPAAHLRHGGCFRVENHRSNCRQQPQNARRAFSGAPTFGD